MLRRMFLVVLLGLIGTALSCGPQSAEIWETGQTTSYAAGDDGDLQRGAKWPTPRFTNNGDGTVTDNLTLLIWLKNANCFGTRTWNQALSDANTLYDATLVTLHGPVLPGCGLRDGSVAGDWRLPNRKELRSLIDYSQNSPALPSGYGSYFINVQWEEQYRDYWSSSTYASLPFVAWLVDIGNGSMVNYDKITGMYVWPVRGP